MSTMHTIGERVRALRKLRGLTQLQLANAADFDPASISRLERGETNDPTAALIDSIAQALGVSSDALMRDGEPESGSVPPPA